MNSVSLTNQHRPTSETQVRERERPAPAVDAAPAVQVGESDLLTRLTTAVREHGDVITIMRGQLLAHPDAVRDMLVTQDRHFTKTPALRRASFTLGNGLLTNSSDSYRRQRALIQPSLHPKSLDGYAEIMTRHSAETVSAWRDGAEIDLHREMMRLTLAIVAEALFGTSIGPEVDQVSHAMDLNVAMFRRLTSPWGRLKVLLPTPFTFRFLFARRRLVGTLKRVIAERRRTATTRDDLLSRLLKSRDDRDSGMTERQMVDECVTLFAAGHETTANALTFTLWLLAQHPEVVRRLRGELEGVLGVRDLPVIADLDAMPYARMVVAESMRLYPPAWIQGRQAKQDVEVAGLRVRRGKTIFISQWITHRDERWWPDPMKYDPDRFLPANVASRPRWAYFPFGGGSRNCVGEAFAWVEAMLALSVLIRRWDFELVDRRPLRLEPGITLRPAEPVRIVPRSIGGSSMRPSV